MFKVEEKYSGGVLPRISKKIPSIEVEFLKKEKEAREKLGLPKEKSLIFVTYVKGKIQKFQISNFKFAEKNGYCVVDCIVENKQKYRIHSDYLAEMQQPGFVFNEVLPDEETSK